jgi:hypothetical protein
MREKIEGMSHVLFVDYCVNEDLWHTLFEYEWHRRILCLSVWWEQQSSRVSSVQWNWNLCRVDERFLTWHTNFDRSLTFAQHRRHWSFLIFKGQQMQEQPCSQTAGSSRLSNDEIQCLHGLVGDKSSVTYSRSELIVSSLSTICFYWLNGWSLSFIWMFYLPDIDNGGGKNSSRTQNELEARSMRRSLFHQRFIRATVFFSCL